MRVSLPPAPCKPYLATQENLWPPPACQPLPCQVFWDLTIIHPTPEAEEDMRAAALCLWPFRFGESSGLEEPITSRCQDVCGFVLQGCNGGFSFVVDF